MLGTILLINLAGAVALLLWGTHMVSSGVLRGFGTVLRNWLGRHLGNRWLALLAGLGITGLLQSSTATSLMAASFTASGTLGLAPALAVMLGANVGTTLVVQLLSFDTSLLAPLALLSGLLLFRLGDGPRLESLGQCLIGLGLMLLALALLGHSLQQIEASPAFVAVIHGLEGDPLIALLLAALLTWACHSSVAVVLLVASMAQAGLVSLPIALALVLGANLGGALPALGVAGSRVARRLPLGNLLVRLLGCLLVLPWLTALAQPANALGGAAAVWFHSAFNLALALLAIGFTGPLAALLARLLPEEAQSDDPGMPRYLDEAGLEVANIGLANATREVLRLADMASLMLRATSGLLQRPEAKVAAEIRRQDQALDQLSAAIRAYLADLGQDGLGDSDADRAQEILLFAINIEHIGDLVANSLLPLAMRWAGAAAPAASSSWAACCRCRRRSRRACTWRSARSFAKTRTPRCAWWRARSCCSDWRPMPVASASVACATIAVPGWSPVTCSSAFSATTDASTIMSPPWPIRCSNAAASIRWRSGRTSQGKGRDRHAPPDLRRTPFQGRRTPAPGARPVPRPATGGAARPPAACRQRPAGRGRALVPRAWRGFARLRLSGAQWQRQLPARVWRGRPRRCRAGLVLVFPGGRLASELIQVAHAADVPLMLAYRPLSAP